MCTNTAASSKRVARESTLRSDIQRHFVLERVTISWSRADPCAALDGTTAAKATSAPRMLRIILAPHVEVVSTSILRWRDGALYDDPTNSWYNSPSHERACSAHRAPFHDG